MQATAMFENGVLYLSGRIDEEFDAAKIFDLAKGSQLTLDLSRVAGINSVGIMKWVPAVTALASETDVTLRRVAYSLVMQANAVLGFFGTSTVESVMAPYYCSKCKTSRLVEVSAEMLGTTNGTAPEEKCGGCGEQLDFDELDDYFSFMEPAEN